MDNLPKRDDPIYREIEQFKDYELTECIAYEMAIRTPLVQEYINLYNDIKNYTRNYLKLSELENKIDQECWLHCKDINFTHDKYNIADQMPAHINNKAVLVKVINNENDEIAVIDNNELKRQAYKTTLRPSLSIPKEYQKDISVHINFNLPKKEIIKYIEMLKDFNDQEYSIGISKDMINKEKIIKYENTLPKTKGKADTLQTRWADSFYIYDCYKLLKPKLKKSDENIFGEIDLMLLTYYNTSSMTYYSIDNYKNIMKDMKKLIDNYQYKMMIIGQINLG